MKVIIAGRLSCSPANWAIVCPLRLRVVFGNGRSAARRLGASCVPVCPKEASTDYADKQITQIRKDEAGAVDRSLYLLRVISSIMSWVLIAALLLCGANRQLS